MNEIYQGCAKRKCVVLFMSIVLIIVPIRNYLGTVKQLIDLFRVSGKAGPRAGRIFNYIVTNSNADSKRTRLLKIFSTRWVEHLDSPILFVWSFTKQSIYIHLYIHASQEIYFSANVSNKAASKANILLDVPS